MGAGRPTKYDPKFNEQVRKFALLGLTDAQMADLLDIGERTFNRWKIEYPEFRQSINAGKVEADAEVAQSTYKRALGYNEEIHEDRQNKEGDPVTVKRVIHVPGDPQSQRLWLFNRQPKIWRDKQPDLPPEKKSTIQRILNIIPKGKKDAAG